MPSDILTTRARRILLTLDGDISDRIDSLSPQNLIYEGLSVGLALSREQSRIEEEIRLTSLDEIAGWRAVPEKVLLSSSLLREHIDSFPLIPPERVDSDHKTKKIINWNGLSIGISHRKGEDRRFGVLMKDMSYGHIRGSWGHAEDGMSHDIFVGPNLADNSEIYRLRQLKPDGGIDEHKYGIGFDSPQDFKAKYQAMLPPTIRESMFGGVEVVDPNELDPYRKDSTDAGIEEPIDAIVKRAFEEVASIKERWIEWIYNKLKSIEGTGQEAYDAASRMLPRLFGSLPSRDLQDHLEESLILTDLYGRHSINIEADSGEIRLDAALPDWAKLPFAEALDYFRAKINLPSSVFNSLAKKYHDRAFTVATIEKADTLDSIRYLLDQELQKGVGFDKFLLNFRRLAGRKDPAAQALSDQRISTIYDTNIRRAWGAGRDAQMRDPAIAKSRPLWLIKHRDSVQPRPGHQALHNKCIPSSHAFWDVAGFPQWGFGCRCGVFAIDEATANSRGYQILSNPPDPNAIADPGFRRGGQAQVDADSFDRAMARLSPDIGEKLSNELGGDRRDSSPHRNPHGGQHSFDRPISRPGLEKKEIVNRQGEHQTVWVRSSSGEAVRQPVARVNQNQATPVTRPQKTEHQDDDSIVSGEDLDDLISSDLDAQTNPRHGAEGSFFVNIPSGRYLIKSSSSGGLTVNEALSSEIARSLGIPVQRSRIIPATDSQEVLLAARQRDLQQGGADNLPLSMHDYVSGKTLSEAGKFSTDLVNEDYARKTFHDSVMRGKGSLPKQIAFDVFAGHTDGHADNFMMSDNGEIIGIDKGLTFFNPGVASTLRKVIEGFDNDSEYGLKKAAHPVKQKVIEFIDTHAKLTQQWPPERVAKTYANYYGKAYGFEPGSDRFKQIFHAHLQTLQDLKAGGKPANVFAHFKTDDVVSSYDPRDHEAAGATKAALAYEVAAQNIPLAEYLATVKAKLSDRKDAASNSGHAPSKPGHETVYDDRVERGFYYRKRRPSRVKLAGSHVNAVGVKAVLGTAAAAAGLGLAIASSSQSKANPGGASNGGDPRPPELTDFDKRVKAERPETPKYHEQDEQAKKDAPVVMHLVVPANYLPENHTPGSRLSPTEIKSLISNTVYYTTSEHSETEGIRSGISTNDDGVPIDRESSMDVYVRLRSSNKALLDPDKNKISYSIKNNIGDNEDHIYEVEESKFVNNLSGLDKFKRLY